MKSGCLLKSLALLMAVCVGAYVVISRQREANASPPQVSAPAESPLEPVTAAKPEPDALGEPAIILSGTKSAPVFPFTVRKVVTAAEPGPIEIRAQKHFVSRTKSAAVVTPGLEVLDSLLQRENEPLISFPEQRQPKREVFIGSSKSLMAPPTTEMKMIEFRHSKKQP